MSTARAPGDDGPAANALAALLRRLEAGGIRLGLDAMRRVLAALGDPHLATPSALVAGTNGKGSTAALLAGIAGAAGYRVGLYTSPHLESPTERVRIDGFAISDADLVAHLESVLATAGRHGLPEPTYFEAVTAAGFLHFATTGLDLAVLEVGMGGRLDATNVAEPVVSLVSAIGHDHEEHLGRGLAAIAREKAGILRRGRPAWTTAQEPDAAASLATAAAELGTELRTTEAIASIVARTALGRDGQRVDLRTSMGEVAVDLPLSGPHQPANLALAVAGALTLAAGPLPALDLAAVATGAAATRWPGRLESVHLPDGRRVLLDAAHNPAGVAALGAFLDELGEPVHLVFGALADKDVAGMLPPLAARAATVTVTTARSERALPAAELAVWAGEGARVVDDPERALAEALANGTDTVLVCGSLYLVGALRAALTARFGVPTPAAELALWQRGLTPPAL